MCIYIYMCVCVCIYMFACVLGEGPFFPYCFVALLRVRVCVACFFFVGFLMVGALASSGVTHMANGPRRKCLLGLKQSCHSCKQTPTQIRKTTEAQSCHDTHIFNQLPSSLVSLIWSGMFATILPWFGTIPPHGKETRLSDSQPYQSSYRMSNACSSPASSNRMHANLCVTSLSMPHFQLRVEGC